MNAPQNHNNFRWLLTQGVEIAGGAVGAALALYANDALGAALIGGGSAALTSAIKDIGDEFSRRLLGPRESIRIGAVLGFAIEQTKLRLEGGDTIRTDGFFAQEDGRQPDAHEIAESVLLKSQREPQEKKIQYMGYFLANVAFNSDVDAHMAHQLLKLAEQLTYRQLCIMKLAQVKERYALSTTLINLNHVSTQVLSVVYECYDLYRKGCMGFHMDPITVWEIIPGKITVNALGLDLYELLALDRIPDEDVAPIAAMLSEATSSRADAQ